MDFSLWCTGAAKLQQIDKVRSVIDALVVHHCWFGQPFIDCAGEIATSAKLTLAMQKGSRHFIDPLTAGTSTNSGSALKPLMFRVPSPLLSLSLLRGLLPGAALASTRGALHRPSRQKKKNQ